MGAASTAETKVVAVAAKLAAHTAETTAVAAAAMLAA